MNQLLGCVALLAIVAGCRGCDGTVRAVKPEISLRPEQLDFGKVKVGLTAERTVRLGVVTNAPLAIEAISVEGPDAAAFEVIGAPETIPQLSEASFVVRFQPAEYRDHQAALVVASNDEQTPRAQVALLGAGATPKLEVTPTCEAAQQCQAAVQQNPLAITFAPEPYNRQLPVAPLSLPALNLVNAGEVPLAVSALSFEGQDAAAFLIDGVFPAAGLTLEPGAGVNVRLKFRPTSAQQTQYSAEAVIASDDKDQPEIRVALSGTLRPNAPPQLCVNIVRVQKGDGSGEVRYNTENDWAPLLVPPAQGYDFSTTRDIVPKSDVTASAHSSTDPAQCTFDPDDGRVGLTYLWQVIGLPAGVQGLALTGANTPQVIFRPIATGEYALQLTVTDAQGASSATTLKLAAVVRDDLVAQLSWSGFANVDLDVHLIRPSSVTSSDPFSGAFSFFDPASGKTAGDISGYAATVQKANAASGFNFNWGSGGTADDPRLNVDDTGGGQLLENVSLSYPENDPACDNGPCRYKVMVHYFGDGRPDSATACTIDGGAGCESDGKPCSCGAGQGCVADVAPAGTPAMGTGRCYVSPKPVVRLFFRGSPTPAQTIPLDNLMPADDFALGAPCQLWYVADVVWPQKGNDAGVPVVEIIGADGGARITDPQIRRYGIRSAGDSQACAPNTTLSNTAWFAPEP